MVLHSASIRHCRILRNLCSSKKQTPMNLITICSKCEQNNSEIPKRAQELALQEALETSGLAQEFSVRWVDCMNVCNEPVTIALQGQTKATYVFAGVSLNTDINDIVTTCQAYLTADGGWIEDAKPCGRLRHCLKSRIPALSKALSYDN